MLCGAVHNKANRIARECGGKLQLRIAQHMPHDTQRVTTAGVQHTTCHLAQGTCGVGAAAMVGAQRERAHSCVHMRVCERVHMRHSALVAHFSKMSTVSIISRTRYALTCVPHTHTHNTD